MFRSLKLLFLIKGIVKGDFRQASGLMGEMHGFPQKMGQHFTFYRTGPAGMEQYFRDLCVTGRPEDVPINRVLAELGLSPDSIKLAAQASIGQVYLVGLDREFVGLDGESVGSDGESVALKVKYPGVEKKIRDDFRLLRGIVWPLRFLLFRHSGLPAALKNLEQMLLAECDYSREAADQQAFHSLFHDDGDIFVPAIIAHNEKGIASRWVKGQSLINSTTGIDSWFIETYLRFIIRSLCRLNMVHADPHPGNFIITGGEHGQRSLAVIDYGSVVAFTGDETKAVIRLLTGDYEREQDLVQDLLLLGVRPEVMEMYGAVAGDLVSVLLEPFYHPGEYDFQNWRLQYKINTVMVSRGWDRPLDIPLKLLLLFRTLQGLYYYARSNPVMFNWHGSIRRYLD